MAGMSWCAPRKGRIRCDVAGGFQPWTWCCEWTTSKLPSAELQSLVNEFHLTVKQAKESIELGRSKTNSGMFLFSMKYHNAFRNTIRFVKYFTTQAFSNKVFSFI